MECKQLKHNKFLESVISQSSDFDSELSDFEDIGTPHPRGAHLSDNETSPRRINPERSSLQGKNRQINDSNDQETKMSSLSDQLYDFYEKRVRTGLTRKETCEDIAYAVTYKVLRKVQTVDDRFRANSLVPHGIPYDGLRAGEPIFLEMILNLPLGLQNTLYVKKDNEEGPFARIQPMSKDLWKDCLTNNGFISASKVQHLLRRYVKQAVHVLRKYMSQGRKEKYPRNLKSLFIEGATGVTLIINRDIKVRVLPAFCIPDSRRDAAGMDCPSSSHVVCCPKTPIQNDLLSMVMELPLIDTEKGINIAWRVSFYVAEKNKMRALGQGCRIQLLRILTEIRDNEDALKSLSSYHLKTVLFKISTEMPDATEWSSEKLADRFYDILNVLKNCLVAKCLPHFFMREPEFSAVNLLEGIDDETLENMIGFVEDIIQDPMSYLSSERSKERDELWPWEADFIPFSKE